ncbi:hypothetical protein SAMN02745830_06098 [Streptomyces sp. Amel2xC10]|nr:hypothetical protein SAMN02745830_06098 [Streptomyces sp. Amel2xC10]
MAWDEWEHLKAEAAEQHAAATRMQPSQYPADGGGPGNSLIELAGLLYEGRSDLRR